jgi:hypothetical protein
VTASRSILLKTRKISEKKFAKKIKTHFIFNNLFKKIMPFMDNVEKYGTAGEAIDDNII